MNKVQRSNWPLCILMLMFILPFMITYIIAINGDKINFKTTQYGSWINPLVQLDLKQIPKANSWNIIYLVKNNCDNICNHVYNQQKSNLNNMHKLFGKDQKRITISFIEANKIDNIKYLSDNIIIVDPLGKAIMQYPSNTEVRDIFKDLRRLLKYSNV